MTDNSVDLAVIKRTQDSLGKYIKKPPLTEKLLRKPPFRFLYDVFNTIIKETGCFEGLYTEEEQLIDNIKNREDKMKYLKKMIDVIKITTNRAIQVRTSKIVAGQEPEKTNELLQLIGEVIEKELDWRSAVDVVVNKSQTTKSHKSKGIEKHKEKVAKSQSRTSDLSKEPKSHGGKNVLPRTKDDKISKNKNTSSKDKPSNKEEAKPTKEKRNLEAKDKISRNSRKEEERRSKSSKSIAKEKRTSKPEEQSLEQNKDIEEPKNRTQLKKAEVSETEANNSKVAKTVTTASLHESRPSSPLEAVEQRDLLKTTEVGANDESFKDTAPIQFTKLPANQSDATNTHTNDEKENNNIRTEEIRHIEPLNKPSEEENVPTPPSTEEKKPQSTQSSPPQNVRRENTFIQETSKDNNNNNNRPRTSLRPPSGRPASARPGAPRRRDRNVEIILQPNEPIKMSDISVKLETFGDFDDDGENLVILESAVADESFEQNQILNATAADGEGADNHLEQQGHLVQQILETQKELVHQNSDASGKHENSQISQGATTVQQSSVRHINNLRDVIQNLTKSVNPFGKLMDFIPEDIDAMQLELTMWRDSYAQTAIELKREKSLTESITEPMKNQLLQIEANLLEYQESIDATRAKILQNSEKIMKLLTENHISTTI